MTRSNRFHPTRFRLSLLTLLAAALSPIAQAGDCGDAPEGFGAATLAPAGLEDIAPGTLFQAPLGWIVAPTVAEAICASVELQAAEAAFIEHFGIAPKPGLVLDVAHVGNMKAIDPAGVPWVLPWRFQSESRLPESTDPREAAIRAQIQQQLAAAGKQPDPRQIDLLVEQSLNALDQTTRRTSASTQSLEPTAMRHELAHLWFIRWVWQSGRPAEGGYASGAPDWLDEMAAIAAESPQMTLSRRRQFAEALSEGRWIALRKFLDMPHPALSSPELTALLARAREQAQSTGASVLSVKIDDAPEQTEQAVLFYSQARSLLDYLRHRSRSPRILLAISQALHGGDSFTVWLEKAGADMGLASDIDALERDWLAWARAQPPTPQAETGK